MNILTIIRADEIVTDAVDSLMEKIVNLEEILCSYTENMEGLRLKPGDPNCSKGSRLRTMGGSIPQNSAQQLEVHLLLASSQLFSRWHDIFVDSMKNIEKNFIADLSPISEEIDEGRI